MAARTSYKYIVRFDLSRKMIYYIVSKASGNDDEDEVL